MYAYELLLEKKRKKKKKKSTSISACYFISPGKIFVPAVSWSSSMVTAVLVASVCAGRRETAPHCDSQCLFFHKVYYHFKGRQIWNGKFLAPFEGRLSVQFDLKEIMAVLFVNQQNPRLDADFLVADSKFMKVAFGVGFKMIAVPSSGIVTTSRYVVPTGRVKVPAGRYVVPTGKDNVIVSAGRTKVIPAGRTILVLVVLCLLRVDSIVS
ncbi:hypothetical protein Tco_1269197 [Tanacetum coccineum]